MSALLAPAADRPSAGSTVGTAPESPPARTTTRLRVLPTPRPRLARVPFVMILVGLFGLGMVGLLLLNTTLQNQAFEARVLTRQAAELAYTQGELESQIDQRAAPQELARRASGLGMRANPQPAFVVAPSGKVVGDARPVRGSEVSSLIVKSPQEVAADRAAALARKQARAAQRAEAAAASAQEVREKAERRAAQARRGEQPGLQPTPPPQDSAANSADQDGGG